jgi:hypothetical protein
MWINTWLALASCTPLHRGLQKNEKNNKNRPAHVKHTHKLKKEAEIT